MAFEALGQYRVELGFRALGFGKERGEDTVRYVVKGYKKVEKEICSVKGYQLVFQKIQMWDEELNYDNHNGPICASELQVISEALDAALNRNDAGENSDTRFGVEGSGLGSFVPRTI